MTPRQCKDIPDEEFLAAADEAIRLRGEVEECLWTIGATRWDLAAVLAGHPEGIGEAFDYPEMPQSLLLAKAGKLIRRGLLMGCVCGCRGGFERPSAVLLRYRAAPYRLVTG